MSINFWKTAPQQVEILVFSQDQNGNPIHRSRLWSLHIGPQLDLHEGPKFGHKIEGPYSAEGSSQVNAGPHMASGHVIHKVQNVKVSIVQNKNQAYFMTFRPVFFLFLQSPSRFYAMFSYLYYLRTLDKLIGSDFGPYRSMQDRPHGALG